MTSIGHVGVSRRALALGAGFAALLMTTVALPGWDGASLRFDGAAFAQAAGSGAGGNPGVARPSGTGSGGTSGGSATPHGSGAGGSTAGSGAGAGGSGTSVGPGPVNQNRFGGGATVAPPPAESTTTTVTNTLLESLGGGSGGESYGFLDRCAGYLGSKQSPQERLSGRNLDLVNAAQVYLAPDVDPDTFKSATYLLASYQEEIDRGANDPLVAGSYLGLAATVPVTPEVVGRVNAILCVTTRAETAREIAENAETERRATQK